MHHLLICFSSHCSLRSHAPLCSFIHLLAHSVILNLMGKSIIRCLNISLFWTLVEAWGQEMLIKKIDVCLDSPNLRCFLKKHRIGQFEWIRWQRKTNKKRFGAQVKKHSRPRPTGPTNATYFLFWMSSNFECIKREYRNLFFLFFDWTKENDKKWKEGNRSFVLCQYGCTMVQNRKKRRKNSHQIIHCHTSLGVSEWGSERSAAQRSAQEKQAGKSKRKN